MRILQITSARAMGGGETHFLDLVNGLHRRGHELHLALSNASPLIAALPSISSERIVSLPLRNALDASSARRLAQIVRERDIEVVHAHMARDYPLAAFAVRKNQSTRLVITRHVLFPMNRLHRIALRKVSRVIAVSEAVACTLRDRGTFPPQKISVVRNGIDVERFVRTKAGVNRNELLRRLKIPRDVFVIGTVGEITRLKGQEDFVRAAALIAARVPNSHFIIAGEDHSRGAEHECALRRLIEKLKLKDRITRLGWLDNLAELYWAMDIFVSASHSESFGLAIVEAMASGTASVASATAGAKEIVEDGVSGKLVPIADPETLASAVIDLAEDASTRARFGRAAQLRAQEQFGVERMVTETEDVYRAAFSEHSR